MGKKIKCDVKNCKHCECDDCTCELDEIKVCNCGCSEACDEEETMCSCFEEKD